MMPTSDAAAPRVLVILAGIPLHGQERGNIEVFRALKGRGVEALFVTHAGYGHESVQPYLDRLGLRWTTAAFPGFWSLRPRVFWERLRECVSSNRAVVRAARAFRPTHLHAGNERNLLNLLPAVWWLRLPVVFRLGDAPRAHRLPFRLLWRYVLAPSIDQMVTVSAFIRERAVGAGVPPGKVRVIRNAPPVRPAPENGSDLAQDLLEERSGLREPWPGRTIVYMGQLTEEKGVGLLVDAARRLCAEAPEARFLLAGDYTWHNSFAAGLRASVARDGLDRRIRFLGYVEDIEGLLALADVLAVPSIWEEPLSNVVGEGKRAGVPAVVFPSGGLPELVLEQGKDGFVCTGKTPAALETGLRHYLSMDDATLRACGDAARASMERIGITPEAYTNAWEAVYASTTRATEHHPAPLPVRVVPDVAR